MIMLTIPYNKMHFQTCFQNQIRSKSNLMKRVVDSLKFHFAIWQTLKKKIFNYFLCFLRNLSLLWRIPKFEFLFFFFLDAYNSVYIVFLDIYLNSKTFSYYDFTTPPLFYYTRVYIRLIKLIEVLRDNIFEY